MKRTGAVLLRLISAIVVIGIVASLTGAIVAPGATLFIAVLVVGIALLNVWIAGQKGRSSEEGYYLGLFLRLIGLFIELLLPTQDS